MKQTGFNPIGNQMVIFVLFIRKSFDINHECTETTRLLK